MNRQGSKPCNEVLAAAIDALDSSPPAPAAAHGARALARRNGGEINAVLKTAATACELSHGRACEESR